MKCIKYLFLCLAIGASMSISGQTKQELQEQRKKLTEEISYANALLEETKKNKKLSLNQLQTLKKKIDVREELIRYMGREVDLLNDNISEAENSIKGLDLRLKKLRENYASMIQSAYQQQHSYNRILFLLSADDLNQAYKRFRYLQEYSVYRKSQAEEISTAISDKEAQIERLKTHRRQKGSLLDEKRKENKILAQEKGKHQLDLQSLKIQEDELLKSLRQKQQKAKDLQRAIQKAIEDEMRKAREKAKSEGKSGKDFELTPEAKALSANFVSNKGKLPWPVDKGVVTSKYGKQRHPVLPNITIENNGIEISTNPGSNARAVFSGKVSSILKLPSGLKVVILRHGAYSTIYSNLSDVYVTKGDEVSTKQSLGIIFTDPSDQKSVIDFQLWKGTSTQNPAQWLFKR